MSRQLKPYIDRLRDDLIDHGLYHERNEGLIKEVALAEVIRDNYMDSFKEYGPLIRQIGSQGQTKININPVYVEVRRLLATIISGKSKLGMGNINQTMDAQVETDLDKFITSLEQ